jgi:hypothetical protein
MAVRRILTKRVTTTGEPRSGMLTVNPWPRKPQVRRPIKSVRTLVKRNPADALGLGGVQSTSVDPTTGLSIPAGSGRRTTASAVTVVKKPNMTPRTAKGTKVVKTPRPTGSGRILNPYGKRSL